MVWGTSQTFEITSYWAGIVSLNNTPLMNKVWWCSSISLNEDNIKLIMLFSVKNNN